MKSPAEVRGHDGHDGISADGGGMPLDLRLRAAQSEMENLKALSESTESIDFLKLMVDAMPAIVWIARADGYVEFYNRRYWEFAGLTYQSARGEGWRAAVHPDDIERVERVWMQSVENGRPYADEIRLRSFTGNYHWHLSKAVPFHSADGKVVRWFGTATDISDQKALEETLRKAKEEADEAGRAKDEFLAVLSHELRTPLAAILGWVQLLEMGVLDEKEKTEAIGIIKEQAKVQSQLIEDLLEVSRIINGKFRMRDESVELHAVVRAATEGVRPTLAMKGVHLENCVDDKSVFVRGDPQRLQQVAWNLLNNAVKFTPTGGKVTVALDRLNGFARLVISDTGIGMTGEIMGRLFQRFQQADSSTTRSGGGLGLGLSIAHHIVSLHNGTITAASDGPGLGSTFTVLLPVQAIRPDNFDTAVSEPVVVDPKALRDRRVLLVDDEASARGVISACLSKFGAQVTSTASAAEALEALDAGQYDILLSDVAMPGRDGYDLIAEVRALPGSVGRLPAIALTAFASHEDQTRVVDAGFNLHVAKPVEPLDLVSKVAKLVAKSVG